MKTKFLLLGLLLLSGMTAQAAYDHRETSVHHALTDLGYQTLRDGTLPTEENASGTFGMYQHSSGLMMLMLDYVSGPEKSPLDAPDMSQLGQHLLKDYVGLSELKTYILREHPVRTNHGYAAVTRLRVRFSDQFVEPDTIVRFDYPQNRHVIFLLGMPSQGGSQNCPAFKGQFMALDSALANIVNGTPVAEGVVVKKRVRPASLLPAMRNFGNEPDCWPDDFKR